MKRMSWMVPLLLAFCLPLVAAMPDAVRAQVENSMLVTGRVEIAADGSTTRVLLDQPGKLPSGVIDLVESTASQWRFEPVLVEGVPSAVRARMNLRVVARRSGADEYSIAVRGATFGGSADPADGTQLAKKQMSPPRYPEAAYNQGFQGVVYLVARVGRDGAVAEVFPEQVNLTVYGKRGEMETARKLLADAALRAARRWEFLPPSKGPSATAPHWVVRIPVAFKMSPKGLGGREPAYGSWEAYLPGPRAPAPWRDDSDTASSDAIGDGQLLVAGSGPRLLTPLEG